MSRRGHNWDTQRAVSSRRGSDADYDPRTPRSSHVSVRPEPSYYGYNFANSEKGLSSSLAYGDIKHPQVPDPYIKRPHPFPPHVQRDYKHYKDVEKDYEYANNTYGKSNLGNIGKKDPDCVEKLEKGRIQLNDARLAANQVAAARSGFAHKYPTSYDGPDKVDSHHGEVIRYKRNGSHYAKEERKVVGKLERFGKH